MHELVKRYFAFVQSGDIRYMEPLPSPFRDYGNKRIRQELSYLLNHGYIVYYQRPGTASREYLAIETEEFENDEIKWII